MDTPRENFESAFSTHLGSIVQDCNCGRTFYRDDENEGWEEGELERLHTNPKATPLCYSIGSLSLEGREYVLDCDCWHKRVDSVMAFLDNHSYQIAEWFKLERERKTQIAKDAVEITL